MKKSPSEIISIVEKSLSAKQKKLHARKMQDGDSSYEEYPPYYAEMLNKAAELEDESMLVNALLEAVKEYRSKIIDNKKWKKRHEEEERKYQEDLKNGLPVRRRLIRDIPTRDDSFFNPDIYTSIVSHSSEGKLLTFFGQHDVSIFDVDPKNVIKLNLIDDTLEIQE